jgi:hypothetical protein
MLLPFFEISESCGEFSPQFCAPNGVISIMDQMGFLSIKKKANQLRCSEFLILAIYFCS